MLFTITMISITLCLLSNNIHFSKNSFDLSKALHIPLELSTLFNFSLNFPITFLKNFKILSSYSLFLFSDNTPDNSSNKIKNPFSQLHLKKRFIFDF